MLLTLFTTRAMSCIMQCVDRMQQRASVQCSSRPPAAAAAPAARAPLPPSPGQPGQLAPAGPAKPGRAEGPPGPILPNRPGSPARLRGGWDARASLHDAELALEAVASDVHADADEYVDALVG